MRKYTGGTKIKKIFIHGWSFSSQIWPETFKDSNSIMLDLPLHGKNRNYPTEKNIIEEFSEELYSLITHIDEEVALIGWSLGATVSILTALKEPENLKKLVLIGFTPKFKDKDLGHDPARVKAFMIGLKKDFESTVYNFRVSASGKRYRNIPLPEKEGSIKILKEFINTDLTDRLDKINIPAVFIHGKNDPITNYKASVFSSKKIKNSQLILTEAGHSPFIENPKQIKGIIDSHNS
ncbi:alpha/beta fold hydrolase [Persephonella sp.]